MRLTNNTRDAIISSVMADTKKVDYVEQANALVKKRILASAPKVIRDAYKFDPSVFRHESVYHGCFGAHVVFPMLFEGARDMARSDEILPLLEKHKAQTAARNDANRALKILLSACNTTNDMIAAAPELEKYIPKDAPKKHVPVVIGLTDKHAAAGWPK